MSTISVVPARLGLKAPALAFSNTRPGQSHQLWLGSGLARPRLRLLYGKSFLITCKLTHVTIVSVPNPDRVDVPLVDALLIRVPHTAPRFLKMKKCQFL